MTEETEQRVNITASFGELNDFSKPTEGLEENYTGEGFPAESHSLLAESMREMQNQILLCNRNLGRDENFNTIATEDRET